ncbi:MAG: SDR family NAD(P)-dependent oxidoreductase [bacterium]
MKSKKVLVTGGSRGIGKAIAVEFARCDFKVALHYKNPQTPVDHLVETLPGKGHISVRGDLEDPQQVEQITEEVFDKFNYVDVLINNAGIYDQYDLTELTYQQWLDKWERYINVNLLGPVNLSFLIARKMIEQKIKGKIINITSRGAYRGEPTSPAYGATKAGLNSFSQSLAQALAKYDIYVYGVAPGFVRTDMTEEILSSPQGKSIISQSPLNRVARPEEIAKMVLFLSSDSADYATGAIMDINGASYLH